LLLGRRWMINDFRNAIRSAARDVCRVLKHMNGDGVRQIVVNEETVSPLRCRPFSSAFSVVTSTTQTSVVVKPGHTRLCDPSHQQSYMFRSWQDGVVVTASLWTWRMEPPTVNWWQFENPLRRHCSPGSIDSNPPTPHLYVNCKYLHSP